MGTALGEDVGREEQQRIHARRLLEEHQRQRQHQWLHYVRFADSRSL